MKGDKPIAGHRLSTLQLLNCKKKNRSLRRFFRRSRAGQQLKCGEDDGCEIMMINKMKRNGSVEEGEHLPHE